MPFNRGLEALSWAVVLGAISLAGCGSKSNSGTTSTAGATSTGVSGGGSDNSDAAGAGSNPPPPAGCPAGSFNLLFSPVYSAYDGGAHDYKVPIYAPGVADPTTLTWSSSDDSMVKIESDPNTGGVMVTTQKSGTVSIIATNSNGGCGTTLLTITKATADDWTAGSDRYNMGTTINRVGGGGRMPGAAGGSATDAGVDAQCTSCHGSTAMGAFKTVEHTPYQTGGFSDDDLINIIEHGMVPTTGSCAPAPGQTGPAAACFDPSVVSYAEWQTFHKWDAGDSEKGLVVYLRALVPVLIQSGTTNLGGGMFGTGGRPGGTGGRGNFGNGGRGGASTGGTGNAGAPAAGADSGGAPAAGAPAGGAPAGGVGTDGGTSSGGTGGV